MVLLATSQVLESPTGLVAAVLTVQLQGTSMSRDSAAPCGKFLEGNCEGLYIASGE